MKTIKHIVFTILDILLFILTIFAVFLVFKNPFSTNIDFYINYAFLTVLFLQFLLSENKKNYLKSNIWDIIIIVLLATPILRIFRLLRVFRSLRAGMFLKKVNLKNIKKALKLSKENISLNLAFVFFVVFLFAGLEHLAEHATNPAVFGTFKDSVWWAFATVTTVGYGDISPATDLGRIIAVALMFIGILIYGILISNLTTWLMEKD